MKLNKEQLEILYFTKSNKELCKMLNITNPTLVKYVRLCGLKSKGKGKGRPVKIQIQIK
jgi:hypothetical protein